MGRFDTLQRSFIFVIPMAILWSIAVWIGTLNPDFGLRGSLLTGGVYAIVYLSVAVIVGQQNNNGGAFPSG